MSEIKDSEIKKYWDSLTEVQKYKAFEALANWSSSIDDIRYNPETNSIYWESCGEDISE